MLRWLGIGRMRASAADRLRAQALSPIEALEPLESAVTFVARGAQTRGALPVSTTSLEGAVYSSRGRGYAPYNEDAALLYRDGAGYLYLAVFDQAGGLGGQVRGAASGLAAERVARCFRSLAGRTQRAQTVGEALEGAFHDAHQLLVERGEGEVTTGVAAVISPGGQTCLVCSGDSAAMWFHSDGGFSEITPLHEGEGPYGAGCLTHALGLEPEGPDVQILDWSLGTGEVLLLCSDGLLDAGLSRAEIGDTLCAPSSLESGINHLARRVLRRMLMYQAKPDNLTLAAVRRGPTPAEVQ